MGTRDEEFEKKLLATFGVEADEHIRGMSARLVDLEKSSTDDEKAEIIETIFRETHSLKGAARAVNANEIESICQSLEGIFSALKRRSMALSAALLDVLHSSVDVMAAISQSSGVKSATAPALRTAELVQTLEKILGGAIPSASKGRMSSALASAHVSMGPKEAASTSVYSAASDHGSGETVRVSAIKLNSLLLQVEELRAPKLALGTHLANLQEFVANLTTWAQERVAFRSELHALRETLDRQGKTQRVHGAEEAHEKAISQVARLAALLEGSSGTPDSLNGRFTALLRLAEQDHRALTGMMTSVLEDARKLSLVPFSSLLEGFPKLVRDLCRDNGKLADLTVAGGEIETDRRILEEIKDPLIHLLRNCIDHGIEDPSERKRNGKNARGAISVAITPKDGDKVEIVLSDDGAGIDLGKVRAAAVTMGSGSREQIQRLRDGEALSLIFQSGLSTTPIITNLSGRGLGLAIAREKVEKLGGTLAVESHQSAGTSFRIALPLTLATFRGVLVRSGELLFIVPSSYIERVTRVDRGDIKTIENRETIHYGGEVVSLARFRNLLELNSAGTACDSLDKLHVLILRAAGERIAFQVDEILSEQEILAKPFGQQLSRVRNLAGATILGTGKTVPIINVYDLMKSAIKSDDLVVPVVESVRATKKSILIAEDSITARALLRNILESGGYDVKTAVDGLDAYTALKAGKFDLVVSDVEMPRMTGFDLTAKIRADKNLSEVPIVLVTALDSREDRERGIDVGANAYVVKSTFDDSDLLQIIQRLI